MRMPTIPAPPMQAQTIAALAAPSRPDRRMAANTAATGIGHGAATADPQPTRIPLVTEKGGRTPKGLPGTASRIATRLLYPVAQANPIAAAGSASWWPHCLGG